jgi:hypothetical protein
MVKFLWLVFVSCVFHAALTSCAKSMDPWRELWSSSVDSKVESTTVGGTEIVPASDLRGSDRRIWIITTACLPWLTGTSVNPLLRAAYLAKDRPDGMITLMVPWLQKEDQDIAFPPGIRFNSPDEQREYVQKWLVEDAQLPVAAKNLRISFYNARLVNINSLQENLTLLAISSILNILTMGFITFISSFFGANIEYN